MSLRYPHMRSELLDYLGQLASPSLCRPGSSRPGALDDIVHFFFDDTPLFDDPDRAIGYFLHGPREVDAIQRVVAALDRVLALYGTEHPDAFYLERPEWELVAGEARAADRALRAERAG